jgi:hypothetical protein
LTTPSGTLTYTTPLLSARVDPEQEAYSAALGSYSRYTTTAHTRTHQEIEGWHWDERVWADDSIENRAVHIPANWDPTTSGITQSYFQSGIGSNRDLELERILFVPSSGLGSAGIFHPWAPEIRHGYYYDYEEGDYLFSDDSEVHYATYSGVELGGTEATAVESGFNYVDLSHRPKVGVPIDAVQYKWDEAAGRYDVDSALRKKVYFTGERDADLNRLETWDDDHELILWDNIDRTTDEFIVTLSGMNPRVVLNDQYVTAVGWGAETIPSGLETAGYATGEAAQQFRTIYSPIDSTMGFEVYSYITASGGAQQWEPIDFDETPSGYQVKADYDLGILEFGDPTMSGQLVPEGGATIGTRYWKTYRVEYEPDQTADTVLATETNINPVYRRGSRGFLYLSTQVTDPASIILRAELPEIQTNIFGPLFIGNTFAPVVATVKDQRGQTLEGETVSFSITSSPVAGSFGSSLTASSSTDEIGEARAYYNPPRSISDIGESVGSAGWSKTTNPTDPEYSGMSEITTLQTTELLIEGDPDQLFVYEVYADDPHLGILDGSLDSNYDVQVSGFYVDFFDDESIQGPTRDVVWEDARRMAWELSRPTIFESDAGMGRKQLVSKVDSSMLNPYTYEYGAVGPVQPVNIEGTGAGEYDVVFDTSVNAMPEPGGVEKPNMDSYFVVAPTTVSMQASVYNERLNRYIFSNEISVKLSIPSYLSGLWILDAINQTHIDEVSSLLEDITASGQKVPLGFRLRSSRVTLAAALDGVTFLDLNRPYNYDPWDQDVVASGLSMWHQVTVSGIT